MSVKIYQVDSFTDTPFKGNPAAVCVLEKQADEEWMKLVAKENNLAETAFVYKDGKKWNLRWFTPEVEVDLCGHGTLAAAHILFTRKYAASDKIDFFTKSGILTAVQKDDFIELNFPVGKVEQIEPFDLLKEAVGVPFSFAGKFPTGYMVELENDKAVREFKPNLKAIKALNVGDLLITAKSDDKKYDFVSRCFAPSWGIAEDPVTGSTHCSLAVYWSKKLNKTEFNAYQASERGGSMKVRLDGGRAYLLGKAVTIFKGKMKV